MKAVELPGTCALQVIYYADTLVQMDAYNKREAKKFDTLCEPGHGTGQYKTAYITGSIMTISDVDEVEYKELTDLLIKKGWKELGSWPGAHGNYGEYQMHLWGSPSFKLPKKGK